MTRSGSNRRSKRSRRRARRAHMVRSQAIARTTIPNITRTGIPSSPPNDDEEATEQRSEVDLARGDRRGQAGIVVRLGGLDAPRPPGPHGPGRGRSGSSSGPLARGVDRDRDAGHDVGQDLLGRRAVERAVEVDPEPVAEHRRDDRRGRRPAARSHGPPRNAAAWAARNRATLARGLAPSSMSGRSRVAATIADQVVGDLVGDPDGPRALAQSGDPLGRQDGRDRFERLGACT